MFGKCNLCHLDKELRLSHIIPQFVYKWIKLTSATNFFISPLRPEKRYQDGPKEYQYCDDCEGTFNIYETEFARKVFYPYVDEELDENCIAKGKIKKIKYRDWLLKFIISLQYRDLIFHKKDRPTELIGKEFEVILNKTIEQWRNYILGNTRTPGKGESHMFFYQNLAAGKGVLPNSIHKNTTSYLLRAVDSTLVLSDSLLGNYIKIGPISFFTTIFPYHLKRSQSSLVKKRGSFSTIQKLKNLQINQFLFITRPKEVMDLVVPSKKRQKRIEKSILKDHNRFLKSKTLVAQKADWILNQRLKKH